MEFKAEQKYVRISPTKVRPLLLFVKPMGIERALEVLPLVPNKGASVLLKVIKSAVSNATQKGFSISDLVFEKIIVNEGPRLKRGRPVSRGMWHPYVRRTSHIRVILRTRSISENETIVKQKVGKSVTERRESESGVKKEKMSKVAKKSDAKKIKEIKKK